MQENYINKISKKHLKFILCFVIIKNNKEKDMLLLEEFVNVITRPNVIAGIILAAVGLALTLLAKKITRIARKKQDIDEADKLYLALKGFALVMILVALIVMIIEI